MQLVVLVCVPDGCGIGAAVMHPPRGCVRYGGGSCWGEADLRYLEIKDPRHAGEGIGNPLRLHHGAASAGSEIGRSAEPPTACSPTCPVVFLTAPVALAVGFQLALGVSPSLTPSGPTGGLSGQADALHAPPQSTVEASPNSCP